MKKEAAVILGSGFSFAAGLPLLPDIFSSEGPPFARSKPVRERYDAVKLAWSQWSLDNPGKDAELWLRYLYREKPNGSVDDVGFEQAKNFLLASLVQIDSTSEKAAYIHGITKSVESQVHRDFWQFILREYELTNVVTMNYDILAEQGLRQEYGRRRIAPLCHYGGRDRPQIVKRVRDPIRHKYVPVELTGKIEICKMHGSVNWALEGDDFILHEDVRAACRVDRKAGSAAIVPPLPENFELPWWLERVWESARIGLSSNNVWIVCGYSMPEYDGQLRTFFASASAPIQNLNLYILDPNSKALARRWEGILPHDASVHCLPGIPEALASELWPD